MRNVVLVLILGCSTMPLLAQVPVTPAENQARLLDSNNKQLAANKKLVYDFWRTVLEGHHTELADKFLAENYIQHNPNVASGRQGFVNFFSRFPQQEIKPTIQRPVVAIVAEGNLVTLAFVDTRPIDASDKTKTYTTTWFDMFRIEDGKIAEHWDGQTLMQKPAQ